MVLDCVIKSNPSVIALEWFKDKYLLSNTNKYQILPNNSLLIRHLKKSDRGQYYCVCNNTVKKAVSPIIKLDVIEDKWTEMANVVEAVTHETIKLPCHSSSSSASSPTVGGASSTPSKLDMSSNRNVKWRKINSIIGKHRFEIDSNGSLVISNLRSKDAGYYLCVTSSSSSASAANNEEIDGPAQKTFLSERLIKLNIAQNKTPLTASFEVSSNQFTTEIDQNDVIG